MDRPRRRSGIWRSPLSAFGPLIGVLVAVVLFGLNGAVVLVLAVVTVTTGVALWIRSRRGR